MNLLALALDTQGRYSVVLTLTPGSRNTNGDRLLADTAAGPD